MAQLTDEQMLSMGVGADFWRTHAFDHAGIPALCMADGPSGVRYQRPNVDKKAMKVSEPATSFPSLATLAATWDRELAFQMGRAVGAEALDLGVDVVLGPGLNIKRSPLCGRNFEYYSEDPLLTGALAVEAVRGIQSTGTGSCIKHFAVNSQEYKRFSNDSIIDERTLRELYLRAFEHVVRDAAPEMVMSAYVMLNGTYCSDNVHLLREILREEWGFRGCVVTDWGGMHDRVSAYEAGCDLAMPGGTVHNQARAAAALAQGRLSRERVIESTKRMAALAIAHRAVAAQAADYEYDRAVARRVASEGHVLLTNDGVLPLKGGARVALVGALAEAPRYQGGGSSYVNARRVSTLRDVAPDWAYAAGYDARSGKTNKGLVDDAVRVAATADAAVVVVGLPETIESEGYDRVDMQLPDGMNAVIEAVAAANPRTVVVLQCGSPVEVPWESRVAAVLYAGLGGEAGAEATFDVLVGRVNPSGHLPETWPCAANDAPCMGWWGAPHRQAQYREGVFVGYRYYETARAPVAFCFGHGLSYTTFSYDGLDVGCDAVSFVVSNDGQCAGAEVAQVYLEAPAGGIPRPRLQLAGFVRVELEAGESRRVTAALDPQSRSVWDGGWREVPGEYRVLVGSSVRDIRLRGDLTVKAGSTAAVHDEARLRETWYAHPEGKPPMRDFRVLLGRDVPAETHHGKGTYDETDSLLEMGESSLACRIMTRIVRASIERGYDDPGDPACRMSIASSIGCALFGLVNCAGRSMPLWLANMFKNLANGRAPWARDR